MHEWVLVLQFVGHVPGIRKTFTFEKSILRYKGYNGPCLLSEVIFYRFRTLF